MANARRFFFAAAALLLIGASSGCSMFHELQIHRLWRLNYGPGTSSDAYYSIGDAEALRPEPNSAE